MILEFLEHRLEELLWAIIFGLVVAIYFDTMKGKKLAKAARFLWDKFARKVSTKRNLSEQEVTEAIRSNHPDQLQEFLLIKPICEHNALTWDKKWLYADVEKKYFFPRKFSVLPLINGNEIFFGKTCQCLASELEYINKVIENSDKFLFVYLNKDANRLFKDQLVGQHWPGKIQSHPIICDEPRTTPRRLNFEYELGESLSGFRVVLLECFVLVPDVLTATIKWLQDQGAIVEGVAILFMGAEVYFNDNACGIDRDNVKVGYFVDLKVSNSQQPKRSAKELKLLTYGDY